MEFNAIIAAARQDDITHYICMAHQVNRAAKWASGTGGYTKNMNEELSQTLEKMHEINGKIYRNEKRLKVLYDVQRQKKRYVKLHLYGLSFYNVLLTCSVLVVITGKSYESPTLGW